MDLTSPNKKNHTVKMYQGTNQAWFISVNGKILCGTKDKNWADIFLETIKNKLKSE